MDRETIFSKKLIKKVYDILFAIAVVLGFSYIFVLLLSLGTRV